MITQGTHLIHFAFSIGRRVAMSKQGTGRKSGRSTYGAGADCGAPR
jgi:hypothetical protein